MNTSETEFEAKVKSYGAQTGLGGALGSGALAAVPFQPNSKCISCGREFPSDRECPLHRKRPKGGYVAAIVGIVIALASLGYSLRAQGRPDPNMAIKDLQINDMQLQHLQDQVTTALNPIQEARAKICAEAGITTPPGCSIVNGKIQANKPAPAAPDKK